MKKIQYLNINFYWFGLSFLWNGIHPIILPALLINFVSGAQKNSYLGLMTFIGLLLAMFIQPISGSISDRTRSKFGRRRPWIFWGVLFVGLFLGLMSASSTLLWLVILYFKCTCYGRRSLVLFPDMVNGEPFRRLRVRLRLEINTP